MAVAGGGMSQTMVVATVSQDDAPVAGVMVEFARSIAGQAPDYQWSDEDAVYDPVVLIVKDGKFEVFE